MKYNLLGKSSLWVSEVGFGCMSLQGDDGENAALIHQAFGSGINFFDTADIYQKGENELTVGKALKGIRQKVILATKVGNVWKNDGDGLDWNPSKAHIRQSVDESLRRLQTDYIDLYQLHGGTIQDNIAETIEAFEILKQQGKIRYYGISSIRPNVIREYVASSSIVSVMMQYSLLDRRPEEACLDLLAQHNVGVLVRGSLAKGLLVDKPAIEYLTHSSADVEKARLVVHRMSNERREATETALRFVLSSPAVKTVVVGIRTIEQLHRCVNVSNTPPLSDQELQELQNTVRAFTYEEHR